MARKSRQKARENLMNRVIPNDFLQGFSTMRLANSRRVRNCRLVKYVGQCKHGEIR